jgi:signal transduction histidine kinase
MNTMTPLRDLKVNALTRRADELFAEQQERTCHRTDLMFAKLMLFQWILGIVLALCISPKTWIGAQSTTHLHVWAAIFIGGIICGFPAWIALRYPSRPLTRHILAVGQMLMSALLIHLTGGRIETHFHVFGSLAFLAFYRDWKVLLTATIVVAVDHFVRGTFWPQSIFGVLTSSPWRWTEHAAWVLFEDFFLYISIRESLGESFLVAERQARLESLNENIEGVVRDRTRELEKSHHQLVNVSRRAGMAEVATSVLHNVGNVLNSINVSAGIISELVRHSKAASVARVSGLLKEHTNDLGEFLSNDPKGRQIPAYLTQLSQHLADEKTTLLTELSHLAKNVDHVKDIVSTQQSYAKVSGVTETLKCSDLIDDAVRMNASALARHDVRFVREYAEPAPTVLGEKHKALQILVNLIRNAKQACDEAGVLDKQMTMRITNGSGKVRLSLTDNGNGISAENLTRIFNHGFTTKKDGHGFGLHSSALAAREMGGSLSVHSEGPGRGATFVLELPAAPVSPAVPSETSAPAPVLANH